MCRLGEFSVLANSHSTWQSIHEQRCAKPIPNPGPAANWLRLAMVHLRDCVPHRRCMLFHNVFLASCAGLLIGVLWLICSALYPRLFSKALAPIWLTVPAAGLMGVLLAATDVGLLLRVVLSERALRNDIAQAPQLDPVTPHWVGLFHVEESRSFDGGVYFYTSHSWLNRHGVAQVPAGSKTAPRTRLRHLYGDWYSFEWRF